jgi:hypothetical protein
LGLHDKKPVFCVIVAALIVGAVAAVCFMTKPKSQEVSDNGVENGVGTDNPAENSAKTDTTAENSEAEEPDINGYHWLSDELYTYELGDLDGNGISEYVEVNMANDLPDFGSTLTIYWNENAIYEYNDLLVIDPGKAAYLDLDRDGEKELFFYFYPRVNSMPLVEYIVLKQNGDSWEPLEMIHGETMLDNGFPITVTRGEKAWEAVIACVGLEKKVTYDVQLHYQDLQAERQYAIENNNSTEYVDELLLNYETEFSQDAVNEICAETADWGIWKIAAGEFEGRPCLVATQEIQKDRFDSWGETDVYFDYDESGNVRFLDIQFKPVYSYLNMD